MKIFVEMAEQNEILNFLQVSLWVFGQWEQLEAVVKVQAEMLELPQGTAETLGSTNDCSKELIYRTKMAYRFLSDFFLFCEPILSMKKKTRWKIIRNDPSIEPRKNGKPNSASKLIKQVINKYEKQYWIGDMPNIVCVFVIFYYKTNLKTNKTNKPIDFSFDVFLLRTTLYENTFVWKMNIDNFYLCGSVRVRRGVKIKNVNRSQDARLNLEVRGFSVQLGCGRRSRYTHAKMSALILVLVEDSNLSLKTLEGGGNDWDYD